MYFKVKRIKWTGWQQQFNASRHSALVNHCFFVKHTCQRDQDQPRVKCAMHTEMLEKSDAPEVIFLTAFATHGIRRVQLLCLAQLEQNCFLEQCFFELFVVVFHVVSFDFLTPRRGHYFVWRSYFFRQLGDAPEVSNKHSQFKAVLTKQRSLFYPECHFFVLFGRLKK